MGSPLKVVGGDRYRREHERRRPDRPQADMLPLAVRVKTSQFADAHDYRVQMVREPALLPNLIWRCSPNAIRHRGESTRGADRPVERDHPDHGPRAHHAVRHLQRPSLHGPDGAAALFSPLASIVNILVRNPMAPVRIESIDCDVQIEPGAQGRLNRDGPAPLRYGRTGS